MNEVGRTEMDSSQTVTHRFCITLNKLGEMDMLEWFFSCNPDQIGETQSEPMFIIIGLRPKI